jgi:hypothetical protein
MVSLFLFYNVYINSEILIIYKLEGSIYRKKRGINTKKHKINELTPFEKGV